MLFVLIFFLCAILANAEEVGKVKEHKGKVDIVKKGNLRGVPVDIAGPRLEVGDLVRTKSNGYALLLFIDGTKVELQERSRLRIIAYEKSRDINIQRGVVKFEVKSYKGIKGIRISTPHALIGVKGTVFWVYVFPGYTKVIVERGIVELSYPVRNEPPSVQLIKNLNLGFQRKEPFLDKPPDATSGEAELEVIIR